MSSTTNPSKSSPLILIVDDEDDVRPSLRRILKLDRYQVEEARSLTDLLARDDLDQFFSIILDRKLPDGTSDEVLVELKERAPETDILIVTGYTDLQGTLAALRHGAEDYLIKPVDPDDLRASLRRLLRLREMKTALRESEARHAGILETAPVGILTLDESGIVESANPAAELMFGFSASDLIQGNASDLFAPPHLETWRSRFHAMREGQLSGAASQEFMARNRAGKTFPVAVTLSSVKLPHKRVITVILEDITERKQLEHDVLQASEDERQRIAQDLHDGLASHLTGISLLCRMLAEQVDGNHSATAHQIGDLIDEAIQQARTVARGLYPVEDDPEGLMNSLARFASQLRRDLKIDSRFECRDPVLIEDNAVATHLYRIAQEAVNNALRHGKAEQIIIELNGADDRYLLRIQDNGAGFPESDSGRTGHSEKPKGLGLRTMAYRAGLLRGTFQLTPRDPSGVEVTCMVPIAEPQKP